MEINKSRIDTVKAFKSISIQISAIQNLCRGSRSRALLESYGIDLHNFDPTVAAEIDELEWVKILLFYKNECRYKPAKDILAGFKSVTIS
jgi:hypothetical protein